MVQNFEFLKVDCPVEYNSFSPLNYGCQIFPKGPPFGKV